MKISLLLSTALLLSGMVAFAQKTNPTTPTGQSCNFAGTIDFGQFIGQSNTVGSSITFLCFGDSLLIHHNGDADLSGDPNPASPPGIAYAFYTCPPTIAGDNLQAIAAAPGPGDPCILSYPPTAIGLYTTQAIPNGGDTWFVNQGALQNAFGFGQPIQLFFAPITIDNQSTNGFEASVVGAPPGPCVNVNIQEAFSIVYLNKIKQNAVDNHFLDDCIGKFYATGGYPEFDPTAVYDVDISLVSDPSIKALPHFQKTMAFHLASQVFSVTEPGNYLISVEDGKSCGLQFMMDMSGCDASDNLVIAADSVAGAPGETLCVPIRVRNFDIISGSLSFNWDPLLLEYQHVANLNPAIAGFFNPNTFLNTGLVSLGSLGMALYNDINFEAIHIDDNDVLFDLCFEVLDTLSPCTRIGFAPNPAQISFEDSEGRTLAITAISGEICAALPQSPVHEPQVLVEKILPNPVKSGQEAQITLWVKAATSGSLTLHNAQGKLIREEKITLHSGENRLRVSTALLSAGVYFVGVNGADGREGTTFKLVVW